MSYGVDVFPIITTKKIDISTQRKIIKVDFCLNLPSDNRSRASYHSMGEMLHYYFFVLDDINRSLIPAFQDKSSRAEAIKRVKSGQIQQAGRAEISLSYIFENHTTSQYAVSDLSTDYNNEIRMSIEIPYNPGPEYENLNTEKLHLVAFAHTPVGPDFAPAPTVGGDSISYDLLLNRDSEDSLLSCPENIETFYVNDPTLYSNSAQNPGQGNLQPYFGPVHYHGEDNPGDNGYIGWMAGAPGHSMGPRLESRLIPNYKISSDLAIAKTFTPTAQSGEESSSNSGPLNPTSGLKSKLRHNNILKSADQILVEIEQYSKENCLKKPNIIDYGSQDTAFINMILDPMTDEGVPLEESHHGCVAGINFLDLVRHRSRLGYILDFHLRHGNHDLVSEYVYRSNVKNLSIFRKRITSRPLEINERQSKKYGKYDKNEQDTFIVSSSDITATATGLTDYTNQLKHRMYAAATTRGSIEEIELYSVESATSTRRRDSSSLIPGPRYSRQFIIRDKDLFHNVRYGNYTYDLDIILNDGVFHAINDMYQFASNTLKEYQEFIFRCKIPVSSVSVGHGSYDYRTREFSNQFKEDLKNQEDIDNAIETYSRLRMFLTGNKIKTKHHRMLKHSLNLNTSKLEDILEFEKILFETIIATRTILTAGVSISIDEVNHMEKTSVENKVSTEKNIITSRSNLGIYVKAFSEESILADYNQSNSDMQTEFSFTSYFRQISNNISLSPAIAAAGTLFVKPRKFFTIDPPKFSVSDGAIVSTGLTPQAAATKSKTRRPKSDLIKNFGKANELSSVRSYKLKNRVERSNIDLKIKYLLKSQELGYTGQAALPASYFPLATQRYFGGVTINLSKGGPVINTPGYSFLERALEFTDSELSEDIKKALCESVYTAKDKDHFLEESKRRIGSLLKVRSALNAFYDVLHNSMLMQNAVYARNVSNTNYSDLFNGAPSQVVTSPASRGDVYDEQSRELEIIVPGMQKKKLRDFKIDPTPLERGRRVVCVSCVESHSDNPATPVNNVVFLGV